MDAPTMEDYQALRDEPGLLRISERTLGMYLQTWGQGDSVRRTALKEAAKYAGVDIENEERRRAFEDALHGIWTGKYETEVVNIARILKPRK